MVIVSILLVACNNPKTYVINSSCAGFKVIKASRHDTTETLRQVLIHNKTYREICRGEDGS